MEGAFIESIIKDIWQENVKPELNFVIITNYFKLTLQNSLPIWYKNYNTETRSIDPYCELSFICLLYFERNEHGSPMIEWNTEPHFLTVDLTSEYFLRLYRIDT